MYVVHTQLPESGQMTTEQPFMEKIKDGMNVKRPKGKHLNISFGEDVCY